MALLKLNINREILKYFLIPQKSSISKFQIIFLNYCVWENREILMLYYVYRKQLGPVVQSVVSLTSSLRVISLTVLADSIYNILIFFAEKM